jgi:hypothetical protein
MPDERKYEIFLEMQQHNGMIFTEMFVILLHYARQDPKVLVHHHPTKFLPPSPMTYDGT